MSGSDPSMHLLDFSMSIAPMQRSAFLDYHATHFIPSAVAIVCDGSGEACVVVKSRVNGRWVLPSTEIQPGESGEEAAVRAVHEQTGLTAGTAQPFIADSGKYVRASGRPPAQLIRFGYRFFDWSGELQQQTATTVDARMVGRPEIYEALGMSDDDLTIYEDHLCTLEVDAPAEGGLVWMR